MKTDFPFVDVPEKFLPIVGERYPDTRMYRQGGTKKDMKVWYDAVWEICGHEGSTSPGGVGRYCDVSRAGVHKRLREGRLTAFLFYIVEESNFIFKRKKLGEGGRPYIEIPVIECKAWGEKRAKAGMDIMEEQGTLSDLDEKFLMAPKELKKKLKKD